MTIATREKIKLATPLLAILLGISSCAVHPLPGDYSNTKTHQIVKNLRCEAKFAVIDRIKELLEDSPGNLGDLNIIPKNILSEKTIELIKSKQSRNIKDRQYMLDGTLQTYPYIPDIIDKYKLITIAYEFEFDITEDNNSSVGGIFKMLFNNGSFDLNLGASAVQNRLAQRKFSMSETFSELTLLACGEENYSFLPNGEKPNRQGKNFIYPLEGSIRMDEVMNTFLDLGALGGSGTSFSDTLTFTTTLNSNIGITASFPNAPVDKFHLLSADASTTGQRIDIHKVTINMAFPTKETRTAQQFSAIERREETEARTLYLVTLQSCIQRAEDREDSLGALRRNAPEQYCPRYARNLTELKLGVAVNLSPVVLTNFENY